MPKKGLLLKDSHISLVCEEGKSLIGFLIGAVVAAPVVYAPGGKSCMIDDFCISTVAQWEKKGNALLNGCRQNAALMGAVQFVIV